MGCPAEGLHSGRAVCGVDIMRFLIPAGALRQCCGMEQSALPGLAFVTHEAVHRSQTTGKNWSGSCKIILLFSSQFLTLIFLRDYGLGVASPRRSFLSVCMCRSVFVSVNHTRHWSAGLGCASQGKQCQALCACLWKLWLCFFCL